MVVGLWALCLCLDTVLFLDLFGIVASATSGGFQLDEEDRQEARKPSGPLPAPRRAGPACSVAWLPAPVVRINAVVLLS